MKRLLVRLSALAVLLVGTVSIADPAADRTTVFRVGGMACALCGKAIEKTLRQVEGVRSVAVDQKAERVTVVANADVSTERLEQAIESAGSYKAELLAGGGVAGSKR
ncbi:MAG: heavy metal-associated domain-containing protein [Myxococcota bacterium]